MYMLTRELTIREQKFAKAAAAGATQAAAYAVAYSDKGSPATQRANGHRIAKKPRVAAEIKRLRGLPAVDDYAGIKKSMIEALLALAANDKNSVAQHRAIVTLIKYADEGAVRQAAKNAGPTIEQLVRELMADAKVDSTGDEILEVEITGTDDFEKILPVQLRSLHAKDDYGLEADRPQGSRLANAAEAKAEAYDVMGINFYHHSSAFPHLPRLEEDHAHPLPCSGTHYLD
jgi:hypothetical protein